MDHTDKGICQEKHIYLKNCQKPTNILIQNGQNIVHMTDNVN